MAKRYGHFSLESLREAMERSFSNKGKPKHDQQNHSQKSKGSTKTKRKQVEENKKKSCGPQKKSPTRDREKKPGRGNEAA
jgi:hypothetical protein